MKKILLLLPLAGSMALSSCISEEPLNMECDILQASLKMENPMEMFYHDYDTIEVVTSVSDSVRFLARPKVKIGTIPLSLKLTEGATAYEKDSDKPFVNGTPVDFSNNQTHFFRVVSEDKMWERQYRIFVVNEKTQEEEEGEDSPGNFTADFEDYALDESGKYYIWQAEGAAKDFFTDGVWKNGNPGFKLSKSSAKPMDYPGVPVEGGGPDGSDCIKLETRDTGSFGAMVNMRIASGSLFNGVFDVSNALKDALKATQFSSPFKYKPLTVSAYIKYEPGEKFQDKKGVAVEGVIDEPDFYAVMYRNTDADGNRIIIDGNDVLTSPAIVGIARLPHNYNADGSDKIGNTPIHGVTGEWQKFTLQMEYKEELDPEILANNGYSFVVSFASSWQGAYFQGAVGSKMWIDKLEVICDNKK